MTYGETGESISADLGDLEQSIISRKHISYDHGICIGDSIDIKGDANSDLNDRLGKYAFKECNDVLPIIISDKTFVEVTNENNVRPNLQNRYLLTVSKNDWKLECLVSPKIISTPFSIQ
jgi:hypothetical protein